MQVQLISMPWALFNRPSIQLGSLKSYLRHHCPELSVSTLHPYLETAEVLGETVYQRLSTQLWAGEALFSGLLFPERREQALGVFCRELPKQPSSDYTAWQQLVEEQLSQYLASAVDGESLLLGFSVCFGQLAPSLWAAGLIRQRHPHLPIVLGGSTITPQAARILPTLYPAITFCLSGEGEKPLRQLVKNLITSGSSFKKLPCQHNQANWPPPDQGAGIDQLARLEELPPPDYHDYFSELCRRRSSFIPQLPVEFSRGCWWRQCSFCNLNLQWQGYRFKKHQQMLKEVQTLASRYQCLDFFFTDNALPPHEAQAFFREIVQQPLDFHFFAEIRAVQEPGAFPLYRQAGVEEVQIGIESLADSLLARMNKGVRAIDNIAAMKSAAESGVRLAGNLILEFPGSTAEDVQETLQALDAVFPYPPLDAATFFLGQGSPVWCHPRKFGIDAIIPHPKNVALFPKNWIEALDMLVCDYRSADRKQQKQLWAPVRKKLKAWQAFHRKRRSRRPALSFRDGGNFLIIRQERPGLDTLHHRLSGLSRAIYLHCGQPATQKELLRTFNRVKEEQLCRFLADLEEKHLLYHTRDGYLALAVRTPSSPCA